MQSHAYSHIYCGSLSFTRTDSLARHLAKKRCSKVNLRRQATSGNVTLEEGSSARATPPRATSVPPCVATAVSSITASTSALSERSAAPLPYRCNPHLPPRPTADSYVTSHFTLFSAGLPPARHLLNQQTNLYTCPPVSHLNDLFLCYPQGVHDPPFGLYDSDGIAAQESDAFDSMELQYPPEVQYGAQHWQPMWPQYSIAPVSCGSVQAQPIQQNISSLASPRDEQPLVDVGKWLKY